MMENFDLYQYLAQYPNVSRLKLVSLALLRLPQVLVEPLDLPAHRDLTCNKTHAQSGHHPQQH